MAIYKGSRYTSTPTYYPDGSDKKIFDIRQRFQFNTTGATYHTFWLIKYIIILNCGGRYWTLTHSISLNLI